jgi:hypothetical protein
MYRDTRKGQKDQYLDGKKHAIPSLPAGRQACTVTVFWLKNQDSTWCSRRVTRPLLNPAPRYPDIICWDFTLGPLYCRTVRCKVAGS